MVAYVQTKLTFIQIAQIRIEEKCWEWLTKLQIPQIVKDIHSICTVQ